jgi:glutamate 5-kinase
LINYSSSDIEKIMGCKSSEIGKILGFRDSDEVIHRDNLVLLENELPAQDVAGEN